MRVHTIKIRFSSKHRSYVFFVYFALYILFKRICFALLNCFHRNSSVDRQFYNFNYDSTAAVIISDTIPNNKYGTIFKQDLPECEIFMNFLQTFSALKLLMESLTPTIDHLNTPERRAEWLEKVHRCRPVVENVISIYKENLLVSEDYVHETR